MALTKIPSSLLDTSGGFDLQGNITLGASEEVQFGDASELKIFNDGSNSVIRSSDNLLIQRGTTPRSAITITDSTGEVALAYGGSTVFQTSSAGATVTGTLTVTGDLDITGNVNSYNVTDLDITDQTITLGAGQTEANSGGSGIIIDGSSASLLWNQTSNRFDLSSDLKVGAEDGGQFSIEISGGATGTAEGGELRLNTAADYDGTYNHYRIDVYQDDFRIGRAGQSDFYIFDSGVVKAENDFTVGGGLSVENGKLTINEFTGANAYTQIRKTNTGSNLAVVSQESIYMLLDENNDQTNRAFFIEHGAGSPGSGTTVFKVEESGNVGIGTSSLSSKFHVYQATGELTPRFEVGDGSVVGLRLINNSAHWRAGIQSTSNYVIRDVTNNRNTFSINGSDGYVGIGTTSPSKTLSVKAPSGSNGGIDVFHNNGNKVAELVHHGSGDEGRLSLYDGGTGTVQIHGETGQPSYINSGNVGIGETSPDNILHIKSTASGGPQIQIGDGTNYGFINFDGTNMQISTQRDMVDGTWYNTSKSWGGINIVGGTGGSSITLQTAPNANTSPTTRCKLDENGRFYFGGTSSYAHNTYGHAAVFGANSVPNGTVAIEDYDVSSGIGNTVLRLFLRDEDPATSATFIDFADGGGRVGSVTHNDDGGGVTYNTTSDYRLKENVNYTWDALPLLTQLKPAKFNFIGKTDKTRQGFLAHEVMDIVPGSVRGEKDHMEPIGTITDSDGNVVNEGVYEHFCKTDEGQTWTQTGTEPVYQELDYARLVPLLTKAIQELKIELDAAKARITELEG